MTQTHNLNFDDLKYEVEVGNHADRASGSALVRNEDAHLLAIVDVQRSPRIKGFQLSTDYRIRASAIGQIPSNFLKREMRPSDAEILMSRLLDRSVRPRLKLNCPAQVVISVMYLGGQPDADIFRAALLAVSFAARDAGLGLPFILGETHHFDGANSLTIAVEKNGLLMAEAALDQLKVARLHEVMTTRMALLSEKARELEEHLGGISSERVRPDSPNSDHAKRLAAVWLEKDVNRRRAAREAMEDAEPDIAVDFNEGWTNLVATKTALGERIDGRGPLEIRHVSVRANMSPSAHGAVMFKRGLTSALVFTTLGGSREAQDVQDLFLRSSKDPFIVHYAFHPYATNQAELGRHMPNRREVGHGHLIKKALRPVLPEPSSFPFVIRLNSEIMSADGSSSMASVIGGTLSMAAAGESNGSCRGVRQDVRIGTKRVFCLDLSEDEDHASAFDLKVTGTTNGVTAIQLDIKTSHLSAVLRY